MGCVSMYALSDTRFISFKVVKGEQVSHCATTEQFSTSSYYLDLKGITVVNTTGLQPQDASYQKSREDQ